MGLEDVRGQFQDQNDHHEEAESDYQNPVWNGVQQSRQFQVPLLGQS